MIIQVDQILSKGTIDIDASFPYLNLTKEITLAGTATLKGTFSASKNDEIFFKGILKARVILKCVKCLEDFEQDFAIEIIETYYPADKVKDTPKEEGFRDLFSNLQSFAYNDRIIDLDEIARDNLVAAIPAYPHCPKCRNAVNNC
jgi:uncharacterized metal-binding protein YceD (DUF177 family)